ncbi:hypothetical protein LRP52_48730 [Photobacterium sp. ZSDE20]|uniref:Peptidylprolyl isomerase n=1 Tax=Photobacterium pectinilyticum TaxID=2906793 RepID=A0ABT1N9B6_9GAMM|nr:hypothetical protein [Photobacterium sp. ZSDE20]MCQ1061338.1 hypothetical protein [Photobacterium sp. ZSDE20]MDD1830025.1 hypothetical protein [Photobacterium sp. ZSDE20]
MARFITLMLTVGVLALTGCGDATNSTSNNSKAPEVLEFAPIYEANIKQVESRLNESLERVSNQVERYNKDAAKLEKDLQKYSREKKALEQKAYNLGKQLAEARYVEDRNKITSVKKKILELQKESNGLGSEKQLKDDLQYAKEQAYKSKGDISHYKRLIPAWNKFTDTFENNIDIFSYFMAYVFIGEKLKDEVDGLRQVDIKLDKKAMTTAIDLSVIDSPLIDTTEVELVDDKFAALIQDYVKSRGRKPLVVTNANIGGDYWTTVDIGNIDFSDPISILSFAIAHRRTSGLLIALENLAADYSIVVDTKSFARGIHDGLRNSTPKEVIEQAKITLSKTDESIIKNKGELFVYDFMSQEGAQKKDDGLYFKPIKTVEGENVDRASKYKVNVTAKLPDGQELFSDKADFSQLGLPPQINKIVNSMKKGEVYQVVISNNFIEGQKKNYSREYYYPDMKFTHVPRWQTVSYEIELLERKR